MSSTVCWNITNVCNLTCQYCFRELNEEAQNLETNLAILDNIKKMGIERITFSGGEPYLYPNILDLMKKTKELGMQCYVVSNGTMLNEFNVEECLQYVDKISFSVDSPREYINEKIGRGYESYNHVRDLIPEIRKYYPKEKLLIDINTVVTFDETGEYKELGYMIDSIRNDLITDNLNKWKIIRFYPLRGKAKDNKERLDISDEEYLEIKKYFEVDIPSIRVDVRDIKDMDDDLIVSPCGLLKQSLNGTETVLCDLKPNDMHIEGCERHV